ncbi:Negative modulator of initiation of replication [Shewanella sp. P1-14-1]|uniref:replication initiation negative regulator SeqA n=1 Tax=Shewanella sp. P1-14-1 TaxID=1723761 RepID=UPI0006D6740E|nr:replication initiation negative regulator SeqA [Shewanella sp. P1-14-1]KPZ71513.1 Negative modulator of initiation of replication [Shewanella sp. P1-14-1]
MKYIEVDEELYRYIASKTERIGESASDILRRLLELSVEAVEHAEPLDISHPSLEASANTQSVAVSSEATSIENDQSADESEVETSSAEVSTVSNTAALSGNDANIVTPNTPVDFSTLVHEHMLAQQKGAVGRFMFLLESLSVLTPSTFDQILKIQGRGRLYFARSKAELLSASQSANPKEIGDSGYWVTTNNNTAKKRTILSEVLLQLGCNESQAKSIADNI